MTETTTKTARQIVLEESGIPEEFHTEVSLLANFVMNTSPGYRPSDAMRRAVAIYRSEGIEGVRAR